MKTLATQFLLALACCASGQAQAQPGSPWSLAGGMALTDIAGGPSLGLLRAGGISGAGLNFAVDAWSINLSLPDPAGTQEPGSGLRRGLRAAPGRSTLAAIGQPLLNGGLAAARADTPGTVTASLLHTFYGASPTDRLWSLGAQWRSAPVSAAIGAGPAKADYALLAGLVQQLGDFSVGANLRYAIGQSSASYGLRSAWSGGVDALWNLSPVSRVGLSYGVANGPDFDDAATRGLALSYAYTFSSGVRAQANVRLGLNDGPPVRNLGLGLTLSHSY